jgi:hypothetical protein
VTTITGSLLELSALVVKEGREKIVVKIMYDRGSLEQMWNSHAPVAKSHWKPLDLPGPDEIPGLDLEVIVSLLKTRLKELSPGPAGDVPRKVFDCRPESGLDQ